MFKFIEMAVKHISICIHSLRQPLVWPHQRSHSPPDMPAHRQSHTHTHQTHAGPFTRTSFNVENTVFDPNLHQFHMPRASKKHPWLGLLALPEAWFHHIHIYRQHFLERIGKHFVVVVCDSNVHVSNRQQRTSWFHSSTVCAVPCIPLPEPWRIAGQGKCSHGMRGIDDGVFARIFFFGLKWSFDCVDQLKIIGSSADETTAEVDGSWDPKTLSSCGNVWCWWWWSMVTAYENHLISKPKLKGLSIRFIKNLSTTIWFLIEFWFSVDLKPSLSFFWKCTFRTEPQLWRFTHTRPAHGNSLFRSVFFKKIASFSHYMFDRPEKKKLSNGPGIWRRRRIKLIYLYLLCCVAFRFCIT